MRLLFLLIPLLLVFNGCGPAPKRYSKPKVQPVFSGKNLGHGIFYYSGEDLVSRVIAKNHKYLSDPYDVKKMLQDLNFVRKVKGKYTLSTLNDIKYELDTDSKKVKYTSFKYSPTKKMYALSGRYMFINRFYSKGKTDVYKWPVRFVAMFDETTKQLQGIYYNANSSYDKQNAYVSENVKAAYFTSYHGGFILNFETLKATSIPNTKLYTFDHEKSKYSKSGRYFATNLFDSHKDGKTERGFLLFD